MAKKKNGKTREVWYDGCEVPLKREDVWSLINNSYINKVVIKPAQRPSERFSAKTELITVIEGIEDLQDIPRGETVMSGNQDLLDQAKERGYKTCVSFDIEGKEALDRSWQEAASYDYAVVDFDLPTNIPLELVIARLQDVDTVLLKREKTCEDLEVAFGVLERGSDGVLFTSTNLAEIVKVNNYLATQSKNQIGLHKLTVTRVEHIGMGARACIDTTGLMSTDEGMIIGSTSNGGIFICSETHYLPYMNLRPFRVNAGAVHSYVWMPDDTAEYLTDLKAGSKILCVNTKGETRELSVGRVKIEMRPLLLISGEASGQEINVIVQDDWHIRVMAANGKPMNASTIKPGSELLAYVCEPGRHVGIKVEETIIEK